MSDRVQALPLCYNDLGATLREAWTLLAEAARDRRSSMHTMSVATIGLDRMPKVRTVVLRHADPETRTIRFHADVRSDKVRELRANPAAQLLAYDIERKIQLRLSGTAIVHTSDDVAQRAWNTSQVMSRLCYRQDAAPGSSSANPEALISFAEHDGRKNFCAVEVAIHDIDWVFLSTQGNRRARFTLSNGTWLSSWIAP